MQLHEHLAFRLLPFGTIPRIGSGRHLPMHSLRALVASLLLLATCLGSASGASSADQLHLSHGTDADGNPQITLGIDPAEGFT